MAEMVAMTLHFGGGIPNGAVGVQMVAQGDLSLLTMIWSGSFKIRDVVYLFCLITIVAGDRPSGTTPNGTRAI